MTKIFWKKINKSRTFDTEPNLYLFVYTSMLILNFHLIEINNWQHLLQQGLFWQNFISPIYMCTYISHCLASPHLAKKKPSCFALLKLLHCLPSSLLLPDIHQSRVPLVKPPRVLLTLPWFSVLIPWAHYSLAGISLYLCIPTFN